MDQATVSRRLLVTLMLLACVTIQSDAQVACNSDPCPTLKFDTTEVKCMADTTADTCFCTDTSCACSAGYTLIGVAGSATCKLTKPTVTGLKNVGYGQATTLTCETADNIPADDIDDDKYSWIIDNGDPEIGSSTTHELTDVMADTDVICSIGHASEESLDSPASDVVTVTVIGRDGATCEDEDTCTDHGYISGTCSLTETGVCSCQSGHECTVDCAEITACTDVGFATGTCTISTTGTCSCASGETCTGTCQDVAACSGYDSGTCTITDAGCSCSSGQTCTGTCQDVAACNGYASGTCTINDDGCSCSSGQTCTATCNAAAPCTGAEFNGDQTCSISATGICTCGADNCECGDGYTLNPTSKKCLAGLQCTGDAQCTTGNENTADETPYSTCNTDLGVCNCADGYHVSGSACIRSGKECTEITANTHCTGDEYANPRSCDSNNRCECAADNTMVFEGCSTDKGKPCKQITRDVDCPSTESKYTGTCGDDERCDCAEGSEKVVGDCSGVAAMAGSLLLLALTTVMSRLF